MVREKVIRGKHAASRNRTKFPKKVLALIICATVLLVGTVGGTIAWLVAQTPVVENTFTPAQVSCDVVEPGWQDGSSVKSNVKIQNTSNVDAYIRVTLVANWVNTKTNAVYAQQPVADTDYTLVLNTAVNDGWFKVGNYYYCKTKIAADDSDSNTITDMTPVLINSCSQIEGKVPEGYTLQLQVIAEAIQADGVNGSAPVVQSVWKDVIVNSSNNQLVVKN